MNGEGVRMQVTIEIPNDIAEELAAKHRADLPRAVLEKVALEGYRSGELTLAQVRRLLGFEHRLDVEAFLKERGVYLDYTLEDLERDRETHRSLGL
jgi:predicted HTH domain antitoxin